MINVPISNNSYAESLVSVLKPENYAAIYARHSIDRKESVSNDAQFTICREIAKSKNLIVYKEYGDQGSGVTMSPESREEFQKLFVDAKAGLFKTIIIWKIDRLSRKSADFYDICKKIESLDITIIFGDMLGFENIPKMYKSFMQNTFINLAQLEPELIREKANASRAEKRKLGIFSPSRCPFGYIRKKSYECLDLIGDTIVDYSKIKSYYVKDKFNSRLIEIIYSKYISNDNVEIKDIYKIFEKLLNNFNHLDVINSIDDITTIISESEEISLPGLISAFKNLNYYNIADLKVIVKSSLKFLSKHSNIVSILTNTYYCKKFALNTDKSYPTIVKDSNNNFVFNDSDFITCINFDEIISLSTFTSANIKYYSKQNQQI
uniref:recombinase family protein n=1 Tax=Clostridium cuniculi TaxID=2548455 RepID=UPI0018AB9C8B